MTTVTWLDVEAHTSNSKGLAGVKVKVGAVPVHCSKLRAIPLLRGTAAPGRAGTAIACELCAGLCADSSQEECVPESRGGVALSNARAGAMGMPVCCCVTTAGAASLLAGAAAVAAKEGLRPGARCATACADGVLSSARAGAKSMPVTCCAAAAGAYRPLAAAAGAAEVQGGWGPKPGRGASCDEEAK